MASEEARRREALFDIAKTARLVALEAERAIEIADDVAPQIDSHANLVNAYHGSWRVQMQARLAGKRAKVVNCKANAESVERSLSSLESVSLRDIATDAARTHARLAELRSLIGSLEAWNERNVEAIAREVDRQRK
jgi:hypothetical protein